MNPYKATADAMDTDAGATGRGGGGPPASANLGHGHGHGRGQVQGQQGLGQAQSFDSAWSLLLMARQLIDQGNPSLALQVVMTAMKSRGGENAVFQTLERARDLYRNKLQENAAADELASLFAECVIAEAQPANLNQPQAAAADTSAPPVMLEASNDTSILAMSGRRQIMLDAFSDGSSFICLKCGGLVSNDRKDEHLAYWCGKY